MATKASDIAPKKAKKAPAKKKATKKAADEPKIPKKRGPKPKPKPKPKVGRPGAWRDDFVRMGYKLALLGCTDKEMADIMGISERTFYELKAKYPQFTQALNEGKELADAEVASRLFDRACGVKIRKTDIKCYMGTIIKTPLVEEYPPDTSAAIFWLTNRRNAKWRRNGDVGDDGGDAPPVAVTIEVRDARRVEDGDEGGDP